MATLTRILSIDGGGIRGIIPGQVLAVLEHKLQKRTGNPDAMIADFFDLIAGTSTGGILTCIYLCPNLKGNPKRPRFSAQEAVELYLNRGNKIFDISRWQNIRTLGGITDEKYDASELKKTLAEYLDDLKLSQLLKPCLITSYDIEGRRAKFFTQHDARKKEMHDYLVRDVARATSAAPTYFETHRMESMTGVPYPLIDGGVFVNNPALCAYSEVRKKIEGNPAAKDMAILSIGTGYVKKSYAHKDAKDWGAIEWIKPLIDIMMSGVSETVDYQLAQIYDAVGHPEQYLRINSELASANPEMDDASSENLLALKQDGTRIAEEFDGQLDSFVELLIA
ncbi:MAG: patatin-like phospholipase family protein [Chloroflexota bacterium]|nr:patatin-like phospholipase family protein [Chloroflexota bacterium]